MLAQVSTRGRAYNDLKVNEFDVSSVHPTLVHPTARLPLLAWATRELELEERLPVRVCVTPCSRARCVGRWGRRRRRQHCPLVGEAISIGAREPHEAVREEEEFALFGRRALKLEEGRTLEEGTAGSNELEREVGGVSLEREEGEGLCVSM